MRNANELITIYVSRFGGAEQEVEIVEDSTVQQVLDAAHITLASNEKVYCEGVPVELNALVDDGDTISVVGNKEGGLK